jgi:hypothetical protein
VLVRVTDIKHSCVTSLVHMRTTLRLIGKAVSELMRLGLSAPVKTRVVNGLIVFDVPEDSEPVTSELVKQLEIDES